jgi:hypothetical protein
VAQYLPTLFAGGGRFATVTTEAVALSAGGNRRVLAVQALLQIALPMAAFGLAALAAVWAGASPKRVCVDMLNIQNLTIAHQGHKPLFSGPVSSPQSVARWSPSPASPAQVNQPLLNWMIGDLDPAFVQPWASCG